MKKTFFRKGSVIFMHKRVVNALGLLLACACLLCACDHGESSGTSSDPAGSQGNGLTASDTVPPSGSDGPANGPSQSGESSDVQGSSGGAVSGQEIGSTPSRVPSASSGSTGSPSKPSVTSSQSTKPPTVSAPNQTYTGKITVKTPIASGKVVHEGNGAVVDASNMSEGYIMVKCVSSAPRLKLQIKFGDFTYNYDLNKEGRYEVFPLQGGSTSYTVRVMENLSGTKYRQVYSVTLNPQITNANTPFLYPSQYVNFSASSKAVKKSYDLCVGASTDLKKIEAIYTYITGNISYDTSKAEQAKKGQLSGYLPNVDSTLNSGKGICFDYAALMAAMLRAQNIPSKLVIGKVAPGDVDHAWNLVYTKEKGWIAFKIEFKGGTWKLMDSTFGASKGQNIEQYIGNGSKYTQLRVY